MIAKGAFPEPAGTSPPSLAPGAGLLVIDAPAETAVSDRTTAPFIFEQQRLEAALWFEDQPLKAMARAIVIRLLPAISSQAQPWTLHAFASNPNGAQPLTQRRSIYGKPCSISAPTGSRSFPGVTGSRRRFPPPTRSWFCSYASRPAAYGVPSCRPTGSAMRGRAACIACGSTLKRHRAHI